MSSDRGRASSPCGFARLRPALLRDGLRGLRRGRLVAERGGPSGARVRGVDGAALHGRPTAQGGHRFRSGRTPLGSGLGSFPSRAVRSRRERPGRRAFSPRRGRSRPIPVMPVPPRGAFARVVPRRARPPVEGARRADEDDAGPGRRPVDVQGRAPQRGHHDDVRPGGEDDRRRGRGMLGSRRRGRHRGLDRRRRRRPGLHGARRGRRRRRGRHDDDRRRDGWGLGEAIRAGAADRRPQGQEGDDGEGAPIGGSRNGAHGGLSSQMSGVQRVETTDARREPGIQSAAAASTSMRAISAAAIVFSAQ